MVCFHHRTLRGDEGQVMAEQGMLEAGASAYRCPRCGSRYRAQEAAARSYFCCGVPLRRLETDVGLAVPPSKETLPRYDGDLGAMLVAPSRRRARDRSRATAKRNPGQASAQVQALEVIPPAGNTVDALGMSGLLAALGLEAAFALEIAADWSGRRFVLRARPSVLSYLCSQMESVYDQVSFQPLEKGDVARRLRTVALVGQFERRERITVAMGQLRLRRLEALPLRTFQEGDFEDADPILGILGGLGRLEEGDRLLSQLVLRPAPGDWADGFQSLVRAPEVRLRTQSPLGLSGGMLLALAGGLGFSALLRAVTFGMQGKWVPAALLALGLAPLGYLGARAARTVERNRQVDAEQVRRKVFLPGFCFQLRLAAEASTSARAQRRLGQLAAAYRQFDTGAGNGFILEERAFDPCDLDSGWQDGVPWTSRPRDIINSAEVASLWHLPWGDGAMMVRRGLAPRRLPLPEDVSDGVPIGTSSQQGRTVRVCLPPSAKERNKLLVAKTRKGKTTLMLHLAQRALRDPRQAVVFLDPHGDAVSRLAGLVPRERVDDVVFLDFGAQGRVPAWNLLDVRMGFAPELIVESFIYTGRRIWTDFWGPRMEDVVRHVLWTLVRANQMREPGEQYTVLDIQAALLLDDFQRRLRVQSKDDVELKMWWGAYYDSLHRRQRLEVVNPVLTKIQRFASSPTVRRVISRPSSTILIPDLIAQGGILLVNLPGGEIGLDNVGFLGSVLLSYLEVAIRSNQALAPSERPGVTCFIDECGSIPFSYQTLLAELVKMGANFTLVTQSLRQLEDLEEGMIDTTLANIDTLAVFQTSGRDARELTWELGDETIKPSHVVNLPEHSFYLKTQREGKPLPVMRVELNEVPDGDGEVLAAIEDRSRAYTLGIEAADEAYRKRTDAVYGVSLEQYEARLRHWQESAERADADRRELREARERARAASRELPEDVQRTEENRGGATEPKTASDQPRASPAAEGSEKQSRKRSTRRKHTRSKIMD